jgi:hypothetical protein
MEYSKEKNQPPSMTDVCAYSLPSSHTAKVRLHCASPAVHSWVNAYILPFCSLLPFGDSPHWDLRVSTEETLWRAEKEKFEIFARRLPVTDHPALKTAWVCEPRASAPTYFVYQEDPNIEGVAWYWHLDVAARQVTAAVLGTDSTSPYVVARLIRSILIADAVQNGWNQFHAACFASGGTGTLVLGNKRAGKTTFLISALAQFGAEYVTNDRILLKRNGEQLDAIALPFSVNISQHHLSLLPGYEFDKLANHRYQSEHGQKYRILANQLCQQIGCTIRPQCGITTVLLPTYVRGEGSLFPISGVDTEASIRAAVYSCIDEYQPLWDTVIPKMPVSRAATSNIAAYRIAYDESTIVACLGTILRR